MRKLGAVVLVVWLTIPGAFYASRAATVSGVVLDKTTSQPVGNASIRVLTPARSALSEGTGYFRFGRLPAGTYTLSISAIGYQPQSQLITLANDQSLELTIWLEPLPIDLPAVTIRGFLDNGADFTARQLEQSALLRMSVVAAETIEKSSDITVADVTQRVSGLSVVRDNTGQATKTIIRGTDPKYNYTLVNGIKIPSPDDRGRYIPLAIFPADMVQRIEVYKSLTPVQEGDAIGGAINIVLKEAPNTPTLKLKLATGYHQAFFSKSYTAFKAGVVQPKSPYETYGPAHYASTADFTQDNLSFRSYQPLPNGLSNLVWSRRFFRNRLGFLLAADYQVVNRGSTSSFIPQTAEPQLNNVPSLTEYIVRDFSTTLKRKSIHANIDYSLGTRHKLSLYQFWMNQREEETRFSVDTSLSQGRTVPGTGRISLLQRSRLHTQSIYSLVGQGRHQLSDRLKANWSASYSVASGAYPDWAELTASTGRLEGPEHTFVSTPVLLSPLNRTWLRNTERETAAYADMSYVLPIRKQAITLRAGGLFRQKDRTNFFTSYTFNPAITSPAGQLFSDIYQAQWTNNGPVNPLGAVANPNTYTATEQIGAGYAAAQVKLNAVDWVAGLRVERTQQQFTSSVDPRASIGKDVTINYTDFLPSLTAKISLSEMDKLRLAYFRSISRPALYDVTFYSLQYEDYVEAGNPFLKRARATNVELSYDHTPGQSDFWQISAFYKQLVDPYERTLLNASDLLFPVPDQGLPYTPAGQLTAQLKNFAPATVLGGELSLARYLGKFTVTANYTYTYSKITHVKKFKTREVPDDAASNIVTVNRAEIRPLQGQSPHLANLSVSYANAASGFKAQLSAVYTGNRIYAVSGWYGLDYWQRGYVQLDASAEKRLGVHCQLFCKVNNLLNAATKVDLRQVNSGFGSGSLPGQESARFMTVLKQYDKAMYYVGIQWVW